jgi:hypothetical protein
MLLNLDNSPCKIRKPPEAILDTGLMAALLKLDSLEIRFGLTSLDANPASYILCNIK